MTLQSVIGISLCAAVLGILLKQYRPEFSMVLSVLCGIGVLLWLIQELTPLIEKIKSFGELSIPQEIGGQILIKSLGICLVTQIACDTCRDAGENAIASRLETAGKAAMLLLALPMFSKLLEQALELIG